jgi:hypothetical protein
MAFGSSVHGLSVLDLNEQAQTEFRHLALGTGIHTLCHEQLRRDSESRKAGALGDLGLRQGGTFEPDYLPVPEGKRTVIKVES